MCVAVLAGLFSTMALPETVWRGTNDLQSRERSRVSTACSSMESSLSQYAAVAPAACQGQFAGQSTASLRNYVHASMLDYVSRP